MSHLHHPHNQPVLARDTTTVPTTTAEQHRRNAILNDWANVGLSADIMRPASGDLIQVSVDMDNDGQQQSYCCR